MYEDFAIVEKDFATARRKLRNMVQGMAEEDRVPRIAYALKGRSTDNSTGEGGPALPGLRELPLG